MRDGPTDGQTDTAGQQRLRHAERRAGKKADQLRHVYFLPRDAMHSRGLCCRPVSVSLSVRDVPVLRIHTAEELRYRQTSFLTRWPHHSSFLMSSAGTQFQAPLAGGVNTRVGKISDFRTKSLFISESVRERLMVAT